MTLSRVNMHPPNFCMPVRTLIRALVLSMPFQSARAMPFSTMFDAQNDAFASQHLQHHTGAVPPIQHLSGVDIENCKRIRRTKVTTTRSRVLHVDR